MNLHLNSLGRSTTLELAEFKKKSQRSGRANDIFWWQYTVCDQASYFVMIDFNNFLETFFCILIAKLTVDHVSVDILLEKFIVHPKYKENVPYSKEKNCQ
jgi:hypothetical protein